jgi:hypothetical protein
MKIRLDPNLGNPDAFYAGLIAVNENANEEQVLEFFMKLSLILANQVGDASILQACVEEAAKNDAEQQGNDHG